MHRFCLLHLKDRFRGDFERRHVLYRIFVYDCLPLSKKAHHPRTSRAIDFSRTDAAKFRLDFHQTLRKQRNVALRLGYLDEGNAAWSLRPRAMKGILAGRLRVEGLDEDDIFYDVRQKSVDMKVGLDIASLAFKQQVDRIVLISGDSDFVPAAKLARREGIDFILDPMWADIRADLHEHIDGLRSTCPKRRRRVAGAVNMVDVEEQQEGLAGEMVDWFDRHVGCVGLNRVWRVRLTAMP